MAVVAACSWEKFARGRVPWNFAISKKGELEDSAEIISVARRVDVLCDDER